VIVENGGICQNCFIKFNEYDEHFSLSEHIKSELSGLLNQQFVEMKTEFKEDDTDNVIFYSEYDENAEEVMPDVLQDELDVHSPIRTKVTSSKEEKKKPSAYVKKDKDAGFIVTFINDQKHYTCEICKKLFQSRSRLRSHKQIHSTERNFMCTKCGAKFKTMNCLKNHSRLHTNVFLYCDLCNNKFKGKHELRCHMEAIHLGRKDHIW
jgi:stress-induced morphogen